MKTRTYSELILLPTFEERFEYLKLDGSVAATTFGADRYINQLFYTSPEWKKVRRDIIIRDNGCLLGLEGYEIASGILIHHMNPVTLEQLINRDPKLLDPEYLICVDKLTHNAIHFGDISLLPKLPKERMLYDTCPWKRGQHTQQREEDVRTRCELQSF